MNTSREPVSRFFRRYEVACPCGCGFDTVDVKTAVLADVVRLRVGYAITPTSGCRCLEHNRAVGSNDTSQHTKGRAMDLPLANPHEAKEVYDYLCRTYSGFGFGLYSWGVHIDSRSNGPARWVDKSWTKWASLADAEVPSV